MSLKSDWGQQAWEAGKRAAPQAHETGVANARVVSYSFSRWFNSLHPSATKGTGTTKAYLLKSFKEGWKASKYKSNPASKIPIGKFLPARLNKDGSVSFVVEKGKHKGARKVNPQKRVKNIADGFYANGVFHPIRHGAKAAAKGIDDYRPEALSGPEGSRARSGIRKTTRKKAKKAVRKTAKKTTRRATKKTTKRKR